jgi:hypothetical protein
MDIFVQGLKCGHVVRNEMDNGADGQRFGMRLKGF